MALPCHAVNVMLAKVMHHHRTKSGDITKVAVVAVAYRFAQIVWMSPIFEL